MCSFGAAAVEGVLAAVGGVDEEIVALVELRNRVEAALLERVGAFDASEQWREDGEYSLACWMRARTDIARTDPATRATTPGRHPHSNASAEGRRYRDC